MRLLVATGRFLVGLTALIVVFMCTAFGLWSGAQASGATALAGAVVGGAVGVLIAGSVFGALAALFEIAKNTEGMVRALEDSEARAARFYSMQTDTLMEIMRSSERAASTLEKGEQRAKRADLSSAA